MVLPNKPEIEQVHDEYNRLLREYTDAKEWYEYDKSSENWGILQKALVALKCHNDKKDMRR